MRPRWCLLAVAVLALAPSAPSASGSTLLQRNPTGTVTLKVDRSGIALVTIPLRGRIQHVLAWGAVNTSRGRLRLDFSGGMATGRAVTWQTLRDACRPYRGPRFPGFELVTTACTAPDNSHWAVQEYIRIKPNYGGTTGKREVRLAHWRGEVAKLEVYADWSKYGPTPDTRYPHLFGLYTYRGKGVAVGKATTMGVPLDDLGRNLYLDSLNPDYGFEAGTQTWRRVNGFLANRPLGQYCFEIGPKRNATVALGRDYAGISTVNRYRFTVIGPGVTPDLRVYFDGPPSPFDQAFEDQMNQLQRDLIGNPDYSCGDPGGKHG